MKKEKDIVIDSDFADLRLENGFIVEKDHCVP